MPQTIVLIRIYEFYGISTNLNGICWGSKGLIACSELKECMECAVLSPSKFSLDEEENYLKLSLLLSNFLIVSHKFTSIYFSWYVSKKLYIKTWLTWEVPAKWYGHILCSTIQLNIWIIWAKKSSKALWLTSCVWS